MNDALEIGSKVDREKNNDHYGSSLLNLPPLTSPNDASRDPVTLDALLQQSVHLISMLRMSMGSWLISSEISRNKKIDVVRKYEIPTVAAEMPPEIVLSKSRLLEYMELAVVFGMTSVEYPEGYADAVLKPKEVLKLADEYGLNVQLKVTMKKNGEHDNRNVAKIVDVCKGWLDSGAENLVADPFDGPTNMPNTKISMRINRSLVDDLATSFGLHTVQFEAQLRTTQIYLIDQLGPMVRLCAVHIEEVLEMEAYRRQPYSGIFGGPNSVVHSKEFNRRRSSTTGTRRKLNATLAEIDESQIMGDE